MPFIAINQSHSHWIHPRPRQMTRIVSIVGVGSTNQNWKRAGRMQSCDWTPSLWSYLPVLGLCPWFRSRFLEQWKRLAARRRAGRRSKETRRSLPLFDYVHRWMATRVIEPPILKTSSRTNGFISQCWSWLSARRHSWYFEYKIRLAQRNCYCLNCFFLSSRDQRKTNSD